MKRRVVSKSTVKRIVARSTAASARLERRMIPADYVRPESVTQFLIKRRQQA
ncbi:hypothetical protein L6E12_00205 [Actinokineospora sp. PR83]|uniref:hypothetical protein n=1 Tax=Actinokineospora sp. PR83 TaxID=2884908 RepID=UPI001F18CA5D|nr:hypothetical protein [Actinokineospora sp. PR83]MCG8914220.1 hypothetical protein [Actinokineospora sp. PR83]